jgi:hypothetical protein
MAGLFGSLASYHHDPFNEVIFLRHTEGTWRFGFIVPLEGDGTCDVTRLGAMEGFGER